MAQSSRVEVPWLVLFALAVVPGGLLVAFLTRPSSEPVKVDPAVSAAFEQGLGQLHEDLVHIEELLGERGVGTVARGPAVASDRGAQVELLDLQASDRDAAMDRVFGLSALELYRMLGRPDEVRGSGAEKLWCYAVADRDVDWLVVVMDQGMVLDLGTD